MSIVGKLIGMATIGSTVVNVNLLQRMLSGIVSVVALTIVSALMAGLILVGSFIALYFVLTHYGLEPAVSLLTVGILALAVTAAFIVTTILKLRNLRSLPFHQLNMNVPIIAQVGHIIHSFVDGFLTTGEGERRPYRSTSYRTKN